MIFCFLLAYHTRMRLVVLFSRLFYQQVEFVMALIFSVLFILTVNNWLIKTERMIIANVTLIFLVLIVTHTLALAPNIWSRSIIFLFNIVYLIFTFTYVSTFMYTSDSLRQFRDKQNSVVAFIKNL